MKQFSLHKQSRPVVGKLSPVIAFKVFDCQILSILEYASDRPIWYTGDSVNDLEKNTSKIYMYNIQYTIYLLEVVVALNTQTGARVFSLSLN